jgi:hypothetical protein
MSFESGMQFDTTQHWFGFTFISLSLFTASPTLMINIQLINAINMNNTKSHYVKCQTQQGEVNCMMQDNSSTVGADTVLRFATIQLKPPPSLLQHSSVDQDEALQL